MENENVLGRLPLLLFLYNGSLNTGVTIHRNNAADLLENADDHLRRQNSSGDTVVTGAVAFDGAKTPAIPRRRGRKGMDGMLVRQDKNFLIKMQDSYVACLKVCSLPILLGQTLDLQFLTLLILFVCCMDDDDVSP